MLLPGPQDDPLASRRTLARGDPRRTPEEEAVLALVRHPWRRRLLGVVVASAVAPVVVVVGRVVPGWPVVVVVGVVAGTGNDHRAAPQSVGVEATTTRTPGSVEMDHTVSGGPVWRQVSAGSKVAKLVRVPTGWAGARRSCPAASRCQ